MAAAAGRAATTGRAAAGRRGRSWTGIFTQAAPCPSPERGSGMSSKQLRISGPGSLSGHARSSGARLAAVTATPSRQITTHVHGPATSGSPTPPSCRSSPHTNTNLTCMLLGWQVAGLLPAGQCQPLRGPPARHPAGDSSTSGPSVQPPSSGKLTAQGCEAALHVSWRRAP
jgi:hypothetical protein